MLYSLRQHFFPTFSNMCKPEEGWYGQPKYCY